MDWASVGSLVEQRNQVEEILSALSVLIFGEDPSNPSCPVSSFPGTYPVPLVGRDLDSFK